MATRTSKAAVAVQAADAAKVDAVVTVSLSKKTATERMAEVLALLGKTAAKPDAEVAWGKANGLLGGGSVYINRSNADVRLNQKQVAEYVAQGLGTARGAGQYLRITF